MKSKKPSGVIFFLFFILIFNFAVLHASEKIDIDDTYSFDGSSTSDEVAFEDYDFDFQVGNLDSGADLVCYNWDVNGGTDNYGGEDYCIYTSTTDRNNCISCWGITVPTSDMEQKSSLTREVDDQVCDGCDWDTSDRFGDSVNAFIYYNCGTCVSSSVDATGEFYSVIRPRQYRCENNGNDRFLVRGVYNDRQTDNLEWIEYDIKYCSDIYDPSVHEMGCAKDRDQINDDTGTTILSDPCAIRDGENEQNACTSNNDCISRNCGGEAVEFSFDCDSDGSDGYQAYTKFYEDTCGGEGWLNILSLEDSTCSSEMGNSDYVCDSDSTVFFDEGGVNPEDFCRLKEYSSCTADSECWNDNGGYDCMGNSGNKICTTGANGKNCYDNDNLQCDSGRCEGTCQPRLSNGQSCDENSDCINGDCSSGTCGGTGVIADLAIVDIIPVQVIKDVDLVKGKFGIVRVKVINYGPNPAQAQVSIKFDGNPLTIIEGDTDTKDISVNQKELFDFYFIPNSAGSKQFEANVTLV